MHTSSDSGSDVGYLQDGGECQGFGEHSSDGSINLSEMLSEQDVQSGEEFIALFLSATASSQLFLQVPSL